MGKLIAEYSTDISQTPQTKYLTEDHLGTPRIITDATGQITDRRDFLPFGEDLPAGVGARSSAQKYGATTDDIRQKFTGYQKDKETSLDFAEARMYENRFGRFTAVDPLLASGRSADPQTFNRYVYTSNNPIVRVDPDGQIWGISGTRVKWFKSNKSMLKAEFKAFRPKNWTYQGVGNVTVKLNPRNGTAIVTNNVVPGGTSAAKPAETGYVNREFINGFNKGIDQVQDAAITGVKNVPINFANSTTDTLTGQEIGIPMLVTYRHNLWSNPFRITPFEYSSQRAAELGSAVETGIPLAVAFASGTVGRPGSVSSIKPSRCFIAGTLIHTENGLVPIEKIKAGDKVLSYNEDGRRVEYQTVINTFVNHSSNLFEVKVEGQTEPLVVTNGHPFYVHRARSGLSGEDDDKGEWIDSDKLEAGDQVLRPDGSWVEILSINRVFGEAAVYNFEVEHNHDYFVGSQGVLVHNQGNCNTLKFPNTAQEMDELLGFEGTRIADGPTTPGRDKIVWQPSDKIKITMEQHPYHQNAPAWHRDLHFHVDTPNATHQRFLPGDDIP